MNEHPEFCTCMCCRQVSGLKRSSIGSNGQADMKNMQAPLNAQERSELNAYRDKAQLECHEYYQQMRGLMNHKPPMTVADMQKAVNVNLHARDSAQQPTADIMKDLMFFDEDDAQWDDPEPAPSIPKLIAKLAFRITLVIALAVGVLAVFSN